MKPKIGVVFPKITDKDIADLEIEKIRVSKNRRKIGILLGSDTSAYQQAKVESEVKKACNLTEVIVRVDNRIKQQDKNVMIYEVEPSQEGSMQSASSGPKIKGKANVSDMLYGRPINDDIISLKERILLFAPLFKSNMSQSKTPSNTENPFVSA